MSSTTTATTRPMEPVHGDEYLRRVATFIRLNERGLAEAGLQPRRRPPRTTIQPPSVYNPVSWFVPTNARPSLPPRPITFAIDTHRLFYILMRVESLGLDVGSLDVTFDNPSKPMHYTHINIGPARHRSETLSLSSIRSSLSAVSGLSLGSGWWNRSEPQSIDAELKYIYSSFTKIPALILKAPGPKVIAELKDDPPNHSALPLDTFKNLRSLETVDIDPRSLLGWDRLSESLRSLTIKRSGLEDVSDIFIGAVLDDQARRDGTLTNQRSRRILRRQSSGINTPLPASVPEEAEEVASILQDLTLAAPAPPPSTLSPYKWGFLKHLSLADNSLTFLPTDPLPYLVSITHLDLSSNLLVSIPHGLSTLHNLIWLNLSDNMIDSVLGIYAHLGQVLYLNLSGNRLESICGLERLKALERVDLRFNHVDETAEVGRLAILPNVREVWIEGNPLTEIEDNYRVACFELFRKEGKAISLDGTAPTFYERRGLAPMAPETTSSVRDLPMPASPPVVAIGATKSKGSRGIATTDVVVGYQSALSPPIGVRSAPRSAPGRPKKRKVKRIVDLNGDGEQTGFSPGSLPVALPAVSVMETRSSSTSPQRSSPLSADGHRRTFSAFEPPGGMDREGGSSRMREGELYRARIEALRTDMGEGWLKVFSQSQVG